MNWSKDIVLGYIDYEHSSIRDEDLESFVGGQPVS